MRVGARAAEAIVLSAAGAVLGGLGGWLFGAFLGAVTPLVAVGAVAALGNGAVSGATGIYRWDRPSGYAAFLADSTWALPGVTLGLVVIHLPNVFWNDADYRRDLCRRSNFHLYGAGMCLKRRFAFTLGNVCSNGKTQRGSISMGFIVNHEKLHVNQNRLFGPLYQLLYTGWAVLGAAVATVVWLTDRSESYSGLVQTAAYYDNPFEYWAYRRDGNWRPHGVTEKLAWAERRGPARSALRPGDTSTGT